MNKLVKILLITVMCASLLMLFGCKNEPATGVNGGETQGTQNQTELTQGDDVDNDVTQNPEGDPGLSGNTGDSQDKGPTEPPIGIEDPTQSTEEDDFEVDFGDLTGN